MVRSEASVEAALSRDRFAAILPGWASMLEASSRRGTVEMKPCQALPVHRNVRNHQLTGCDRIAREHRLENASVLFT